MYTYFFASLLFIATTVSATGNRGPGPEVGVGEACTFNHINAPIYCRFPAICVQTPGSEPDMGVCQVSGTPGTPSSQPPAPGTNGGTPGTVFPVTPAPGPSSGGSGNSGNNSNVLAPVPAPAPGTDSGSVNPVNSNAPVVAQGSTVPAPGSSSSGNSLNNAPTQGSTTPAPPAVPKLPPSGSAKVGGESSDANNVSFFVESMALIFASTFSASFLL